MARTPRSRWLPVAAGLCLLAAAPVLDAAAQRLTPAEVAERLTGTWQMNLDESPQFRPQGAFARPDAPVALAAKAGPRLVLAVQRGGRGGGGGALPPAPPDPRMLAGQRAIRAVQQVPQTVTIEATADSVTFRDPRGVRTYAIDNRTHREDVGDGATMTTKTRWDRNTLRQEFVVDETKVTHAFTVNNEGTRIEFTLRIDNFSGAPGRQAKAVYEKVAAQ